ncbi:MAG: endonuclease/exonuclease/phosphatase family protein, partial [Bacteroidales bacterium]|nr:endonuclease/exonuclease/phosphatase family protein [Bacteroidales bacterium]
MKFIKTFKIKYMLLLSMALLMILTACERLFGVEEDDNGYKPEQIIWFRIASFNASLNRNNEGDLITDLSTSNNEQAKKVAEIIQIQKPDILALQEFDFDKNGEALRLFQENYLS